MQIGQLDHVGIHLHHAIGINILQWQYPVRIILEFDFALFLARGTTPANGLFILKGGHGNSRGRAITVDEFGWNPGIVGILNVNVAVACLAHGHGIGHGRWYRSGDAFFATATLALAHLCFASCLLLLLLLVVFVVDVLLFLLGPLQCCGCCFFMASVWSFDLSGHSLDGSTRDRH